MARRQASTDPRAVRTREALLSATVDLLATQPAHELSVTSIVRAAGVSRQVFYEHFTDRDAVVLAAGREMFEPAYREFADSFDSGSSYPDQVAKLFGRLAEREDAVRNLLDSPAQGKLNQIVQDLLLAPIRTELAEHLAAANVQVDDAKLEDTAIFLAAGTQGVFSRGFEERVPAEEIARRIEGVRRTLGAYAMGTAD